MGLSRRSLLTALSTLPIPLLSGLETQAAETLDPLDARYLRQLRSFYDIMATHDEKPKAFFVHSDVMLRFARLFGVEPQWGEFECPWGGDICETPIVEPDQVDVDCDKRTAVYRFKWSEADYRRSAVRKLDPIRDFCSVTWDVKFLELPPYKKRSV